MIRTFDPFIFMTSVQPPFPHDPKLVSFKTQNTLTCAVPKVNKKALFSLDLRSSNVIYISRLSYHKPSFYVIITKRAWPILRISDFVISSSTDVAN